MRDSFKVTVGLISFCTAIVGALVPYFYFDGLGQGLSIPLLIVVGIAHSEYIARFSRG